MQRVERWLQWHFVALTILCGFLLSNDDQVTGLLTLSVVAAISSLVLVDRLKWFYLPSPVAYGLMLLASIYSIRIFFTLERGRQLSAVAILLILVQCVLLFQQKGRRIYEQMAVFCLLQLIVGAVINDALMFGVLLVPVTVLILSSLLLLQTWRPIDRTASGRILQVKTKTEQLTWSDVFASMRRALIPGWLGIVLIAAVSFYALPRARGMQPRNSGNVTIGFTDEITLDQLGKISGNTQIVMRMRLTQRETGQPYTLEDGAYLRGVVLDGYTADSANIGRWTTVNVRERQRRAALPEQFEAYKRKTAGYDVVDVSMDLEATDVRYLFSIPPYHENTESSDLFHIPLRWLLERSEQMDGSQQTKIDYGFGTHAFFRGRQTPWVRTHSRATTRTGTVPDLAVGDLHLLKTFSDERMPTVAKLAKRIVNSLPEEKRNPVDIANAFSSYLSDSGEFKYTRTLDKPPPEDTDPIEDFVSRTKLGHCQYFASALAMMLRSQQIPAQLVVGFRVHEYNPLGKFYIVRQQDAHCWVEAHISSNDIPESANLAGQVNRGGAWLRLDPTPADELGTAGQVGQAMDLAQSLWQEFVIEMNDKRQSRSVYGFMGSDSNMSLSIWERFQMTVTRLRAGQVDASDFSVQNLLSWQAAVITMVLGCLGMLCFAVLRWFWRLLANRRGWGHVVGQRISIAYFATLVRLLSRGAKRQAHETPKVWAATASQRLRDRGLPVPQTAVDYVVSLYYRAIYGGRPELSHSEESAVELSLDEIRQSIKPGRSK